MATTAASGASADGASTEHVAAKPKPAGKRRDSQRNPIQHVHFSSFIIQ
jgi:hypothetical protein